MIVSKISRSWIELPSLHVRINANEAIRWRSIDKGCVVGKHSCFNHYRNEFFDIELIVLLFKQRIVVWIVSPVHHSLALVIQIPKYHRAVVSNPAYLLSDFYQRILNEIL